MAFCIAVGAAGAVRPPPQRLASATVACTTPPRASWIRSGGGGCSGGGGGGGTVRLPRWASVMAAGTAVTTPWAGAPSMLSLRWRQRGCRTGRHLSAPPPSPSDSADGGPHGSTAGGLRMSRSPQERLVDVALKAGRFAKSSNGQLAVWGVLVWLVITGRIGFIFDSFLIIFAVLSVVPVVGLLLFRWWVSSNISEGVCPNCGSAVTGIKAQPFQCMSCGQVIKADRAGSFGLNDPTQATVDVQATDVIDVDVS